ncbi:MAG TPA: DedA family protein [Micromonosporaceae bacterium]|nr:DedA family protein [Micromonosporaceae bacterium]
MSGLVERVLALHGLAIYLTVGLLVFGEDAVFVGLIVPGETAAILGGVAASRGNASVIVLCVIVVLAAILGDNLGYLLGRLYGPRLLRTRVLRRREARVERARRYLERRGGPAVLAGRYIAFLRAVTPFLAGTAKLKYSRFLVYNVVAGVSWGVLAVLVGYLAGNSYQAIERALGPATAAIAAIIVIVAVTVWIVRRRRVERRRDDAMITSEEWDAADSDASTPDRTRPHA